MKKILFVTVCIILAGILIGYGAVLVARYNVVVIEEDVQLSEIGAVSQTVTTNEVKLPVDDSGSVDTAKVSNEISLTVGDVIQFEKDIRTAYFDYSYGEEIIKVKLASSTRYPEKNLFDLPYQVTRVQMVGSEDGVVDHLAFYACPSPNFSESNYYCERFVLNNKRKAVALDYYGQPLNLTDGSVVSYDLNYYPYIYTNRGCADGTFGGGCSLWGFDADMIQSQRFWGEGGGIGFDESCSSNLDPEYSDVWLDEQSYRYQSYALDRQSSRLFVENSKCSGLTIYSTEQEGLVESRNELLKIPPKYESTYLKVNSEFSKDYQHVSIVVDGVEYKYSFKTDSIELVR